MYEGNIYGAIVCLEVVVVRYYFILFVIFYSMAELELLTKNVNFLLGYIKIVQN